MLLYGASGHAKVVCSCLESQNIKINGIFDDDLSIKALNHYKVIGKYNPNLMSDEKMIISIGNNSIRKKISKILTHSFGIVIHKSVFVDEISSISEGSVIFHNAIIQRDVEIGKHVIINTAANIDHDCIIENFVHISPNATLSGNVHVGEGTHIGTGASIIQGINIGKWVTIGAGAVIIRDIPDYAVCVGNPGKIIKYNKIHD
jgi:sugar O-acyltransferase (sialic acid O-acetyltransferase NeuD family)